jgi:hypothetical protein
MSDSYSAPRKRKRLTERSTNPLSEVFDKDEEYKLPRGQMIEVLHHYSSDLDVRMATRYLLNYLLGSGIQLSREQYKLDEKKAETFSLRGQLFASQLWKYLWSLKFVAVIVDTLAAGREDPYPFLILPVEQLEVKYYRDPMGRKWFRYFIPGGGSDVISKEIHHVTTFFLDEDFLDEYGNISSIISNLMPEVEDLQSKRMNTRIADWGRANPSLVTEKPMPKNDPENISALPETFEPQGAMDKTTTITPHTAIANEVNGGGIGGDMYKSRIPFGTDIYGQQRGSKNNYYNKSDVYQLIVDLPEGRTLAKPQIPEAPTDLLAVAAQKKENVFMAFGIPLSMISNASSSSTMKAASGNAGGKKSEGQNSSAKEMFYSGLAEMRHTTIGILEKLLNDYYLREHLEQAKTDNKKEGKGERSLQELGAEAYIKVEIPGRADMDMILQFYYMGLIKHQYLKKAASAVYFIPEDAWEEKTQLSILELNGMQPLEPAASKK